MPAVAVDLEGIGKRYGAAWALRGVSFRLAAGGIHGLVGPNGAGKTTLLKILAGLVRPTDGRGTVLGEPVGIGSVGLRARIGYLPAEPRTYPRWTGGRMLDFLLGFHPAPDPARARDWARRLGLPLDLPTRAYSTGMKQKLVLAAAVCCGADLLVLDEPTHGMDPAMRREFLDLLTRERAAGRTVLLSSHLLGDLDRVCDGFVFLRGGERLDLAGFPGGPVARVDLCDPTDAARIASLAGARVSVRGGAVEIRGLPWKAVAAALAGIAVRSVEYREDPLEERYRRAYGEDAA